MSALLSAGRWLNRRPYFRGRDRLMALALASARTVEAERAGVHFSLDLRDGMARHVYLWGPPGAAWRFVRDRAAPGATVVDVGANIGFVALPAAARVGPEGRVYAFEPASSAYRQLVASIELNELTCVIADPRACGDRAGAAVLYQDEASAEYSSLAPGGRGTHEHSVHTVRLDAVLERPPDIVKVDVEGAEWQVLEGLGEHLGGPVLVVEACAENTRRFGYEPAEMLEWLVDRGYGLEILAGDGTLVPYVRERVGDGLSDIVATPRSLTAAKPARTPLKR
jgi:FkbM family methyltransferase